MMFSKQFAVILMTLVVFILPATAQELSYTPGTVWNFSNIQVEPGQLQRYLDYLAGDWKKLNEFGKKEGYVVSYHVFSVNNARNGEPDLILAVEYRDYYNNAQQLAQQKKLEAFLASDIRKMESQSGERKSTRKLSGGMELQELNLK
ncbi:MAG: hypothetical protein ABJA83_15025 [Burkholderiaceae bacterium]